MDCRIACKALPSLLHARVTYYKIKFLLLHLYDDDDDEDDDDDQINTLPDLNDHRVIAASQESDTSRISFILFVLSVLSAFIDE